MAIIDTFLMLFKADTSNVKKGVDESEKDLKRLEVEAKKADKEIEKIGKSFRDVANSFSTLVAGFVSAHALISGFRESLNYTTEISDLSRELNLNVSTVDAWGQALRRTGGDARSFKGVIQSLQSRYGGTSQQIFDQLPRFADAFSKMSRDQALIRGKQFGLDVPTILLLQQGRREVDALIARQKELGVVTEKDAKITREFNNSLSDVNQAYNTFYRELSREITPVLTKALNYFLKHQDAIKGGFYAIAAGVGALTIALAAMNPYLTAAVALIGAFSVGYEDYKRYRAGLPSALGDIKNSISPSVRHALKATVQYNPADTYRSVKGYLLNKHQLLSNSIAPFVPNGAKSVNVTTGDITINTNATDAAEIAGSFKNEMNKQFNQANDHFASGVN
jgi:hypothetical protein